MTSVAKRLRAAGCVFAEDEAEMLAGAAASPGELDAMVARRTGGEPIEQVVGWAAFRGLRIAVAPGVFVPRRRTELVVREAAAVAAPGGVVVDMCCGSAAIGTVLGATVERLEVYAVDVEPAAVRCAAENLAPVGGRAIEGDLYSALPVDLRGRVDVIVANAPYVPTAAIALMPPEARLHEPGRALDGGADGVDVHRRIAAGAPAWVAPGGSLLIETSERQAPLTAAAIEAAGLRPQIVVDEDWPAAAVIGRAAG